MLMRIEIARNSDFFTIVGILIFMCKKNSYSAELIMNCFINSGPGKIKIFCVLLATICSQNLGLYFYSNIFAPSVESSSSL